MGQAGLRHLDAPGLIYHGMSYYKSSGSEIKLGCSIWMRRV